MFLNNSRYAKVPVDDAVTADGHTVSAIRLRRLPPVSGTRHEVVDHDRLDLLAQEHFNEGTGFWHIADANTALEANTLVEHTGDTLNVPESR